MGYSFTDLGAEGCRRSLNALLYDDLPSILFVKINRLSIIVMYIEAETIDSGNPDV